MDPLAAFGFGGTIWLLAATLAIGVVFAMICGAIRVLRGGDLEDSQKPNRPTPTPLNRV